MTALVCRPATDAEYWVVTDETGRIVAQGSKALCQEVERDGPLVVIRPGDLFDAERTVDNPHKW